VASTTSRRKGAALRWCSSRSEPLLRFVQSGRFVVSIGPVLGDTVMLSMVGPGETFGEIP
jgi:CRP-like cAMP-binding protein